jgi:outer membrane receptor protein involved in Fe transport
MSIERTSRATRSELNIHRKSPGRSVLRNNYKLSSAVATILAMHTGSSVVAAEASGELGLEEITVTAQRRSESIQNVPIAVTAFSTDSLQKLNISTFDDVLKYVPNVTAASNGPGMSNVYMRGLSSGGSGSTQNGVIGSFPNVAIYLDDQSAQLPGRNLDIYTADLERVEILEGPQGTLFGGGAEAGAIRYITNKPKLNSVEGYADGSYSATAGGRPNTAVSAVLNVPLVSDLLAARAVVYSDQRGGYIDNLQSTFTRRASDVGIHYAHYATGCSAGAPAAGVCPAGSATTTYGVPPDAPVVNNNQLAGKDINPVSYKGARVSVLAQINDDWNAMITQSYQEMDAEGVFYQQPFGAEGQPLPRDSVNNFAPTYNHDRFENTALTASGRVGPLKAVYAGSYLDRHVEQQGDYTNYSRGVYVDYYQCYGPTASNPGLKSTCFSPVSTWKETETNTHLSQELRLSTPDDWRIRAIAGVFWERYIIHSGTNFNYRSIPNCTSAKDTGCMTNAGPPPGAPVNDPSTRADNTAFFDDVTRGYKQLAEFASVDMDILPQVLTVTVGTRHFKYTETENGAVVSSFGCFQAGLEPCLAGAATISDPETSFSGTKSRANVTWHVTPDTMLYYTWSQGFRPGGFNRSSTCHVKGADGVKQYCIPLFYTSDNLTNNELGWKTEWFDRRLQLNGAVYQENWNNAQIAFFDPGALGNLFFVTNGQDYRVRGVELSVVGRVTTGLTVQGSASWNSSEQTNSPLLVANNPSSANFGKPITEVPNPFGPIGSPTANSPPLQFNAMARYDGNLGDYGWFAQAGAAHTGHSFSQAGSAIAVPGAAITSGLLRYEMPAYTRYDASIGISRDQWTFTVFGDNLSNSNASTFTNSNTYIVTETELRPRVLGAKIHYKF